MANRPDLIYEARLRGLLSEEAEKMIEEITETLHLKNCKKKKKK
jgi:tRNA (guanine37-N1)-methyltransferase